MEEKEPPKLQENELNELGGEDMNDTDLPEEDGIPKSTTETPSAQEFVELNYKGFNFKVGSCRLIASQLAELSYNIFNLVTKGDKPDGKTTSYLQ